MNNKFWNLTKLLFEVKKDWTKKRSKAGREARLRLKDNTKRYYNTQIKFSGIIN